MTSGLRLLTNPSIISAGFVSDVCWRQGDGPFSDDMIGLSRWDGGFGKGECDFFHVLCGRGE